jgi:FecR protein
MTLAPPALSRPLLRLRVAAVIALALMFAVCHAPAALAAADAGQVLTFNGNCADVAGGRRTLLKVGDTVHVGDNIEVGNGAKLKLLMVDGSVLALAAGTRMTVQGYTVEAAGDQRNARLKLDGGLLRAIVSKVRGPSTFEVDSATGAAAVRSTDWFFDAEPNKTAVTVIDGTVSFAPLDLRKDEVLVPADSTAELDTRPGKGGTRVIGPPRVRPATTAEIDRLIERTSVRYGWCQCISSRNVIKAGCQVSVEGCKADCAGGNYSYVPNAVQSCARFNAATLPQPRH